jgi:hypothetical protein
MYVWIILEAPYNYCEGFYEWALANKDSVTFSHVRIESK